MIESHHIKFTNANQAFVNLYNYVNNYGQLINNTKTIYNIGFYITNPLDNLINCKSRNWSKNYGDIEWQWYLSKNTNAIELSKIAKIWENHLDSNGNVNSNYGYQWSQSNQLDLIIKELIRDKSTRRAYITIYDGKQIENSLATNCGYSLDTPCTLNIGFNIINDEVNMSVMMRSNDLWYGFCNDQYCFSNLLNLVIDKLNSKGFNYKCGVYYHFVNNLHIYSNKFNKQINF
jgi:thymidylate synthase